MKESTTKQKRWLFKDCTSFSNFSVDRESIKQITAGAVQLIPGWTSLRFYFWNTETASESWFDNMGSNTGDSIWIYCSCLIFSILFFLRFKSVMRRDQTENQMLVSLWF